MEHQPSGTAQYSSIPGCSEWGSSFLSDESCPTLSAPCHTSLSVSCLHPNEGKYEQNVSVKCKNQATNMWDTQFPIISYCPHKFPTTKKVKGEFQTFFFLFGIDHWLGYRIHGDKPGSIDSTVQCHSLLHKDKIHYCMCLPMPHDCVLLWHAFSCKQSNYISQKYLAF